MRHLVILTGYPGSGKSCMSQKIQHAFPELHLLTYDTLKEAWFDREGFDGEAEKRILMDLCLEAFWLQLDAAMASGDDLMIEYPFCQKHVPALKSLTAAHGYQPLTVVLAGDPAVLWARFARRDGEAGRHPGHLCSTYHLHGPQVLAPRLSLEEYRADCRKKNYFINLGPTYTLDVTDFSKVDHAALIRFLGRQLGA
ncbi:MAG: AAA family ATPase [Fretibacterium sp.]|nr:AAA family ATPase [Fretibacterium sp.]